MILKLFDQKIRQAFSNSALQYEAMAGLQKEIGRDLIKKIQDTEDCQRILDVGMGTGRLTSRLQFFFPEAKVVGMDFASGMVAQAREKYEALTIVQADAGHLPFQGGAFDIVFSNLAYQWVKDLKAAFTQSYATLKPQGAFCFTLFGFGTLAELFAALKSCGEEDNPEFKRLPEYENVLDTVTLAGFQLVETNREVIKVHFEDMWDLLKWLKSIGANVLPRNFFVGKERLEKANTYYHQHFKDRWGVTASFEVIWIKARKSSNP